MKAIGARLNSNELLDRLRATGRNIQRLGLLLPAGANARHHPPRRTAELKQVSRMKAALFAVGCMPLLGAAYIEGSRLTFPDSIETIIST